MPRLPAFLTFLFRHVYLVFIVLVSFLVFHNETLSGAVSDIQALFSGGGYIASDAGETDWMVWTYLLRNRIVILIAGIIGSTPLPLWLWTKVQERFKTCKAGEAAIHVARGLLTVGLLLLCTAYLIDGSFNPFLYFRF